MKILIATNNPAKYKLVVALLNETSLRKYVFVSPTDLGISLKVQETGSLRNRALSKAIVASKLVKNMPDADEVAYFVGIDDGIRFDKHKKTYSDSKMATDRILKGGNINIGDNITIVRAFGFADQKGNVSTCISRVPMVYLGDQKKVKREEGAYPLEYVLAYKGQQKPIKQLEQDDKNIQNQKYMLKTISKTIDAFLDM